MGGWEQARGPRYDADGAWARSGQIHHELLASLCAEVFSTCHHRKVPGVICFTLLAATTKTAEHWMLARTLLRRTCKQALCLNRTHNRLRVARHAPIVSQCLFAVEGFSILLDAKSLNVNCISSFLRMATYRRPDLTVQSTLTLGVAPDQVEALAFAWLAQCFVENKAGNVAEVTGAKGPRILVPCIRLEVVPTSIQLSVKV